MHPELMDLLERSLRVAARVLRETKQAPLFSAVLDEKGKPTFLNLEVHPEWEKAPTSVRGNVELIRAVVRDSGTSGAVVCIPVEIEAVDGTTFDGFQLHADHVMQDTAYTVTVPFRVGEDGEVQAGPHRRAATDDLLLRRR